jgi:hypothetical protein
VSVVSNNIVYPNIINTYPGDINVPLVGIQIVVDSATTSNLSTITFVNASNSLHDDFVSITYNDISYFRLYYTGTSSVFSTASQIGYYPDSYSNNNDRNSGGGSGYWSSLNIPLVSTGLTTSNYFWITMDTIPSLGYTSSYIAVVPDNVVLNDSTSYSFNLVSGINISYAANPLAINVSYPVTPTVFDYSLVPILGPSNLQVQVSCSSATFSWTGPTGYSGDYEFYLSDYTFPSIFGNINGTQIYLDSLPYNTTFYWFVKIPNSNTTGAIPETFQTGDDCGIDLNVPKDERYVKFYSKAKESPLIFFNKEGDALNFRWLPGSKRWEGDLIFFENSNDVFKTQALYIFESVPSFEYESPGNLKLDKFQLFNEYRFNITGNSYMTQSVTAIELVNTDPNFYSKWIYGDNFESKYPVGTQIVFNVPIFEFTNSNQSYTVLGTKKNGILIIGSINNQTFNSSYGSQIGLTTSYQNVTVSGLNSIGVYNYVDQSLNNLLSSWSEPDFYSKYFNGKKLTLINTKSNDGVVTINNIDIFDKSYYKYDLGIGVFTQSQNILVELIMKTDLPLVYTGGLGLSGKQLSFSSTVPNVLKPGTEFTIPSSIVNTNSIVVDSVPGFLGNTNVTYYTTQSQVIWNNKIYQCVQAYTWSATSSITPDNIFYWSVPTYLPVTTTLNTETLLSAEIHLTTNKIYYTQTFTQSNAITLASVAANYVNDFKFFNIDLYYKDYKLHSDLVYPSLYAEVNFYPGLIGTYSYGTTTKIYEQNVGIEEILVPEVNQNTNLNFNYNIVFTDLDEFGFIIKINGQEYQEQIDWIYVGLNADLQRAIDRTLRNWLVKNYARLVSLGIIVNLQYVGNSSSIYYNSINLRTEYPNVPLQFTVEVGSTADFFIQHSEVVFTDMSNYLSITINGRSYDQVVSVSSGVPDINSAISDWVETHSQELDDYGIYVSNVNSMLIFNVKKQDQRLVYSIRTGKTSLPGIDQYKVINKIKGRFGATIASNEIKLPNTVSFSFEDDPFATGQVVSINNTLRPYDNQEYNILYLGPNDLVLSYQGPFWGTSDPRCDVSPYASIAFSGGFGATGCLPIIPPPVILGGGQFSTQSFTQSFSLSHASTNTYNVISYIMSGNSNIVDMIYLQLTSCMYVLGDKLTIFDSVLATIITTINLPSIGTPLLVVFNPVNNYLYCLSTNILFVVDPIINTVQSSITLSSTPSDCVVNTSNGDVYVSYASQTRVDIWSATNFTSTKTTDVTTSGNTLKMVFNDSENDMYVTQDNDILSRVDGALRTLQTTYSITGLLPGIFFEPVNTSVYVFGASNLINLNSGATQTVSTVATNATFNDLVFNNMTGDIEISQGSQYTSIDLSGNLVASVLTSNYGKLAFSQYDGDVYMASQNSNQVFVLDAVNGSIKHNESFSTGITKMIYDPDRKSMFGIQPSLNSIIEIGVTLNSTITLNGLTYSNSTDTNYGTLHGDYIPHTTLWLKTREYLRKPRENYNNEPYVKYVWKWETDEYPEMFLYDFSGDQLTTTGAYAYTGPKPLTTISLNKNQNKNLDFVSLPEYQKTIFDEIVHTIDHVDSENNLSIVPEPMEIFIGFRADDEGPMTSKLILYKREDISFTIKTTSVNSDILQFKFVKDGVNGDYGVIYLNANSTSVFTENSNGVSRGLKAGQLLKVNVSDYTNIKNNKYVSINNGKVFKIRQVYTRSIVIDFVDVIFSEFTQIDDYPKVNKKTYLTTTFKVIDKELGRFNISGQTEIEDVRYKIELSNTGQLVAPDDTYIFKEYDINEQGIDWTYLNKKRKEMLMVRHDIFPYVGSYKAIINAINYFGYNDLELYEYYRNININSPDFFKLFKVEIPDIFDNTVEGWTVNDFIKHTMPNSNFEDTNLFNLTYKITDKEGNNVQMYSLAEVIMKLQGLKYWLQKNVIPITHRILDITGRADFVGVNTISHRNYDTKIINMKQTMNPVDFKLNEAYLMPINSSSTVYTCHIDFMTATSSVPDYFTVKIRTYKTYKEWNPFTTYTLDDRVTYYGKVYESIITNNKIKNPKKYDGAPLWDTKTDYQLGQIVSYDKNIYEYVGTQSSFIQFGTASVYTPYYEILNNGSYAKWVDITEWKNLNFVPVQTLNEFRTGTHSYNFTIDSNIDPFITIEVTSDNGYGQIYTSKKNYEIRGLSDMADPIRYIDPIGPFEPISLVKTPTL